MRISSHTRDENHNISGFLLMVMGLKIISAQVAAEPLMSLPCAKYVWLVVKNKIGPFQVKFFGWSPSSGDMLPFWELPTG